MAAPMEFAVFMGPKSINLKAATLRWCHVMSNPAT